MPQQSTQRPTTTFTKGLVTEAGELTFPPDASVDELNCSLERDGSRSRRLAVEYETGYSLSSSSYSPYQLVRTLSWENVGGVAGREFAVVQIGSDVIFYDKSGTPLSGQAVPVSTSDSTTYSLDLTTYERPGSLGAALEPIQVTSINGALVVSSPEIDIIYIERDETTEAFTVSTISFKVRDFEWQGDKSTYDEELTTGSVSVDRKYDTKNTGWVGTKGDAALTTYETANTAYPALTHPWYSGKNATDDFDEPAWQKVYSGSTLIVNGHYILDLFDKDRETASGLTGVTTSTESSRFKAVATYAGRVFFSGLESKKNASKVYFSQLVEDIEYIGDCYQVNDPTSEELSDLLDTDGGYISIPEAHNIKHLHVFGTKLLVFAENGVWSVGGVDDVFRATAFSVDKISSVGIINETSFVSADGRPYWWSATGIHTITPNETTGMLGEQNLSLATIQTFWNNIGTEGKNEAVGEYDAVNRQVLWFYNTDGVGEPYKFNGVLVLDEVLGAFYPWTISDEATSTSFIIGTSFFRGTGAGTIDYTVIDEDGNTVLDGNGDTVIVSQTKSTFNSDSEIKLLVMDGGTNKLTFAGFTGTSFLDWGTADYSSYAEAGYDFLGDLTLKKNAPYITTYLRRTETGWTGNETDGYAPIRPSSCKVSAFWDFKTTSSSTAQQTYRLKRTSVVDPDDLATFDYPTTVVTARLKLRGRGRSVRLKFESETGKDFNLLGWDMVGARNTSL